MLRLSIVFLTRSQQSIENCHIFCAFYIEIVGGFDKMKMDDYQEKIRVKKKMNSNLIKTMGRT